MQFFKYDIDPLHIEAMSCAFDKLCKKLELHDDVDRALIDVIVTKIVEIAKAGERDPDRVCELVLRYLCQ